MELYLVIPTSSDKISSSSWNENGNESDRNSNKFVYSAKDDHKVYFWDFSMAYDLCKSALIDYYYAAKTNSDINLDLYIANDQLTAYTERKIKVEQTILKNADVEILIDDVICGAIKVDYVNNSAIYLKMGARIDSGVGYSVEPTEFLVGNQNGRLVILDWYTDGLDSIDAAVRGESQVIDNQDIWNDSDWVEEILNRLEERCDALGIE